MVTKARPAAARSRTATHLTVLEMPMLERLTKRAYVDLLRTASAACRRSPAAS